MCKQFFNNMNVLQSHLLEVGLMLLWKKGVVVSICNETARKQIIETQNDDGKRLAINYPLLTGVCKVGDEILYNATAVELKLGTGGYDFIIANLTNPPLERENTNEHIMKNRYTPLQFAIHSGEEIEKNGLLIQPASDFLCNTPVLIISLHSMLPLLVLILKQQQPHSNIVYVMTDSTSLPIWLSEHVEILLEQRLLAGTITSGQSFGGEVEAVNKFSALLLARERYAADYIIIGPGPGSVGTGSEWGYSAIEVGEIVNAVAILCGRPIVVPRISFSDKRSRHIGISHHLLTTLTKVTLTPAYFPLPLFSDERYELILNQITSTELDTKQNIQWLIPKCITYIRELLLSYNKQIVTMGRDIDNDPSFFQGVCAAAQFALKI